MTSGSGENSRRDVRPETDGREETGGTGMQYGSGFVEPEKRLTHAVLREMVMATLYGGWEYQKRK